eukprot:2216_1
MDKIHCHFIHCYDIGNRLFIKDKKFIASQELKDDQETKYNEMFFSKQIATKKKILSKRKEAYLNISQELDKKVNYKFNQLLIDDTGQYSVGYRFVYGYDGEWIKSDAYGEDEICQHEIFYVSRKYSSLKEEMITNGISTISVDQFNNEYAKAVIHFNSYYCKKLYKPFNNNCACKTMDINIGCLLSLMIYCNYTDLQYAFSKTYRENNGDDHCEFYWLGRTLKLSLDLFGTKIIDGNVSRFYHGIGRQLYFRRTTDTEFYLNVMQIYHPLSTSSSFEVAVNFTNHNNGVIIQFADHQARLKYFAVSWLSDYGNEREYLFIQTENPFHVVNIVDARFGRKYEPLLLALKYINDLTYPGLLDRILVTSINDEMYFMMKTIIQHKLLHKHSFPNDMYASSLCDFNFANQVVVQIDYAVCKTKYSFIIELLFHSEYEWIDMNKLRILFPSMIRLIVEHVNLCPAILDDILKCNLYQLVLLEVIPSSTGELSVQQVVEKYAESFRTINVTIHARQAFMNQNTGKIHEPTLLFDRHQIFN